MNIARIRKALTAAGVAGVTAAWGQLRGVPLDQLGVDDAAAAAGAGAAAAVLAGHLVYWVRNAAGPNGSDGPRPGVPDGAR